MKPNCRMGLSPKEEARRELSENFFPFYRYALEEQLIQYFKHRKNSIPKSAVVQAIRELKNIGLLKIVEAGQMRIIKYNMAMVEIDFSRIRAFWVLLKIMNSNDVPCHIPGSFSGPVEINFLVGDIHYEIYDCPVGSEPEKNMFMKVRDDDYQEEEIIPYKIIMIERIEQMELIRAKHIHCFAIVQNDGNIRTFNRRK